VLRAVASNALGLDRSMNWPGAGCWNEKMSNVIEAAVNITGYLTRDLVCDVATWDNGVGK
jgi:hypothetical protein